MGMWVCEYHARWGRGSGWVSSIVMICLWVWHECGCLKRHLGGRMLVGLWERSMKEPGILGVRGELADWKRESEWHINSGGNLESHQW